MQLLKILFFSVIFALMLSLIGCDLSAMLGDVDDGSGGLDNIGTGGDLDDDDIGENTGTDNGGEGNNTDIPGGEHVCDYKLDTRVEASCTEEGEETLPAFSAESY